MSFQDKCQVALGQILFQNIVLQDQIENLATENDALKKQLSDFQNPPAKADSVTLSG